MSRGDLMNGLDTLCASISGKRCPVGAVPEDAGAWNAIVVIGIVRVAFGSDDYLLLEPAKRALQVLFNQLNAEPTTL
jgi:hypothetical protein